MPMTNDKGEPVALTGGEAEQAPPAGEVTRESITVDEIAELAYEAARAWCIIIGEVPMPPWVEGTPQIREKTADGVRSLLANPAASLSTQHDWWMAARAADGWQYGEVKDPEKKTHPNMVPFDQLPWDQQVKDRLFRHIVHAIIG